MAVVSDAAAPTTLRPGGTNAVGRVLGLPVLITAPQYGQRWFHAPEGPAVMLTHRGCGEPLAAQLTCDQCAQPLTGAQVSVLEAPYSR